MPDIGYLNGRFAPLKDIAISPDDRGFLFGDGIYEVVRAYRGIPVFWKEHYIRLSRSASEIHLPISIDQDSFYDLLLAGIQQCEYQEAKVYVQMTRGVAPRDHAFPSPDNPTVFASFREMLPLADHLMRRGVSAVTTPDIRWGRCDIKSLNLLPNVLAKQKAQESQAFEAIFFKGEEMKEGSTSNVFLVKGGKLFTPERNQEVLAGVTQQQVIDLSEAQGGKVRCQPLFKTDLLQADEAFLVGTTIEVLPLTKVDGKEIADGRPGPVTQDIQKRFSSLIAQICSA